MGSGNSHVNVGIGCLCQKCRKTFPSRKILKLHSCELKPVASIQFQRPSRVRKLALQLLLNSDSLSDHVVNKSSEESSNHVVNKSPGVSSGHVVNKSSEESSDHVESSDDDVNQSSEESSDQGVNKSLEESSHNWSKSCHV
ncbi:hypothetical protein Tco_1464408 [Tanacetum coccineum]